MLKAVMISAGIYKIGQSKLPDIPEPLKPRMLDYITDKIAWNINKSVNRIVYYFFLFARITTKGIIYCAKI
jgi:hypothetical protein